MIVDSPALLAIIEVGLASDALVLAAAAAHCRMPVATRLEASIAVASRSAPGTSGRVSVSVSVTTGEPLLFVGEDFTHTDIAPASI